MKPKVSFIEQSEHSECGLACVVMLFNYYQDPLTLNQLRDIYGVPKGGNTLLDLSQMLAQRGITTKAIRVLDLEILQAQTEPIICFWEERHYVVLEKINQQFAWIVDPASGRKKLSLAEFQDSFSAIALLVSEAPSNNKEK